MSTDITADDLLAALTKRGVKFRFFKDKADFLTHNRNRADANTRVTPGGFGPIKGVAGHNFGSTGSDTNQLAYLYRGDGPTSSKPGPLCLGGIVDDGTVVLMGWGTATHAGPSDPKTVKLLESDALPLDREVTPTTNGTSPGTVAVNPFLLGFEMCHGPEGPTTAQRSALVRATAAIMEMLGGPKNGYSGGSFVMHRELTTARSDPQGVKKDGSLRREVNALLRQWSPASVEPAKPAPLKPTTCVLALSTSRITANSVVHLTSTVTPAVAGVHIFEWSYPGKNEWHEFGRPSSSTGTATARSTPGVDIVYRVRFAPTTPGYAIDWCPNVPLDVVTLRDVDALEQTIADQAARIAELEAAAVPPPAA